MTRTYTIIGRVFFGLYCGERLFSFQSWKRYGLFRKIDRGFSIGPVLFWKGRK